MHSDQQLLIDCRFSIYRDVFGVSGKTYSNRFSLNVKTALFKRTIENKHGLCLFYRVNVGTFVTSTFYLWPLNKAPALAIENHIHHVCDAIYAQH